MDKISAYNAYQKNYYENTLKNKKPGEENAVKKEDTVNKKENVNQNSQVNLSNDAKALLKELQKKYGNMDFIIADYETDEEASSLLSRGTKEYSVLIDPDLLEEMAKDSSVKEKYIGILEDSTGKLEDIKKQLGDDADLVTKLGISVKDDGTVSFFAELEKLGEKQKERLERSKEAKEAAAKEEKKAEEKKAEETALETKKSVYLQADNITELLEKIKEIDWSKVQKEEVLSTGGKFDLSI